MRSAEGTATPARAPGPRVLIVGAGPAGLALAIELGHRGVPCVVIERNDRVGYAPRAKTTNVRTREHLRRWGIADKLRAASPLGLDYPSNVTFITRLSGYGITRFENALYCAPGRNPLYSEHAQWIPQYALEEVLRAHAQSLPGVEIRFNCELVSYQQDADGVRARVNDLARSSEFEVASDYLVGADGARSTVRKLIGAEMTGVHGLSRNYNIIFRAPGLAAAHQHGPAIMYWQINAEVPSIIGPMDRDDIWFFMPMQLPEGIQITPEEAPALIARATGIDLDYQVLSSDQWTASRLIADRYRDRRVFLAGDACHLHPPFGGFGMNMGIGDAVDLGWKMAARLCGWGGESLLGSYQAERRKVHERTIAEAVLNFGSTANQLVRPGLEEPGLIGEATRHEVADIIYATKIREFRTLGIVLGQRYDNSPIIVPDGSEPPPDHFMLYVPSAHPGCLAPHLWLADGSSLYDHFGDGFTLLVTDGDPRDADDLCAAAARHKVPLTVLAPADTRLRARYEARFALIRPDQHVGWRGDSFPPDKNALIARLTGAGH